jgi:tRNA nucleotidyltransferase (CCA-adding enzyme)
VSGERLRRELVKLFDDAALGLDPALALRLLEGWHVLGALEPGLGVPRSAHAPLRRLGRAVVGPPFRRGRWRIWVSGLALWLAPLAPALRRSTLARFAVRGALVQRITGFPRLRDEKLRALARARGRGAIDAALADLDEEWLHALWAVAAPPARRRIVRYADEDRARRAPVSGADLVALGLSGPEIGRALRRIRAAFLDGALQTRDEAIALARELGARRRSRAGRG